MSEQVLAGSLTEEELSNFVQARNVATNILREIGALEVQKTRLLMQIDQNEASAQSILDGAKERLGLEADVLFVCRTTDRFSRSSQTASLQRLDTLFIFCRV